jgi:hypothetical protein
MKSIGARLARAVQGVFRVRGPVVADRYNQRVLETPREIRNAFVYVLNNFRKHTSERADVDPASSGGWFDGWASSLPARVGPASLAQARSWLLRVGWRRWGLIEPREAPVQRRRNQGACPA